MLLEDGRIVEKWSFRRSNYFEHVGNEVRATRERGHARGTRAVTGARERQRIGYSRTDRNGPVVRQLQVAQAGGDLPASGTGHPAARCSIGSGVFRESQVHSTGPSGVEECILHYRKAGKLSMCGDG